MEVNWVRCPRYRNEKLEVRKVARYQEFIQNLHGKKLVILNLALVEKSDD